MAHRLFRILIFVTHVPENYFSFGYSAGSLLWSRSNKSFISLRNVSTFRDVEEIYLNNSRELETHDFQKNLLRVAYYEIENVLHFYDNDTKITGITGEMWNMLSEYLNFTMQPVRTKNTYFGVQLTNGSYDGLLGMLLRNDIQVILRTAYFTSNSKIIGYTIPVWGISYRFYIRPETESDNTSMFHMFSPLLWFSILVMFLIMSILGYTLQRISIKVSREKTNYHNLHDHFFYTFATFCCQGFIPDSFYHRTKILSLSKTVFAWLIVVIVSSQIISFTSNQKARIPFEDLRTMFTTTSYNAIISNGSAVYKNFKQTVREIDPGDRYKNRILYVDSKRRLYEMGCWEKGKFAIFDADDIQRAYGRFKCTLVATGRSYYPTWIAAGVSKTFKYRKTFDTGILKLNECGLLAGLKSRWLAFHVMNDEPVILNPVKFMQVSTLFAILCMGMIVSVSIFVFEYGIHLYRYKGCKIQRKMFC